jgi:hypothetical protein
MHTTPSKSSLLNDRPLSYTDPPSLLSLLNEGMLCLPHISDLQLHARPIHNSCIDLVSLRAVLSGALELTNDEIQDDLLPGSLFEMDSKEIVGANHPHAFLLIPRTTTHWFRHR